MMATESWGIKIYLCGRDSKFRGSNNVWNEERRLTKLLLSRMEESETEQPKKEITSAAGFSGHFG